MTPAKDPPLEIISLATGGYRKQAERLAWSIRVTNPDAHLTLYVDDPAPFAALEAICTVVVAPAIRSQGAKRAKFSLQRAAVEQLGAVLYLDADIVVLEDLGDVTAVPALAAAPDDLSAAPYITDVRHPWPQDPELENRRYVNSGVLVLPPAALDFLRRADSATRDDAFWARYTLPDYLFDNHVLCALLNLHDEPLVDLDPAEWNWPGFRDAAFDLQVVRAGDHLVNRTTGRPLRLVHFAGIRDHDRYLASLPLSIASLIEVRSRSDRPGLPTAVLDLGAALSDRIGATEDPSVTSAVDGLGSELVSLAERVAIGARPLDRIVDDPTALARIAAETPAGALRWNGLPCGGEHLTGEEYTFLRPFFAALGRVRVATLGVPRVRPLLDASGITVEDDPGGGVDLIVIGLGCERSPTPADAAARVRGTAATTVLIHGVHAEPGWALDFASRIELPVVGHFASRGGLVAVGNSRAAWAEAVATTAPVASDRLTAPAITLRILEAPARLPVGATASVLVELSNRGTEVLASAAPFPVVCSYRGADAVGTPLEQEGLRTPLPFALAPGDAVTLPVRIEAPDQPGTYTLTVTAVQEGIVWFDDVDPTNATSFPVEVVPGPT